jgi:hypothetical protein
MGPPPKDGDVTLSHCIGQCNDPVLLRPHRPRGLPSHLGGLAPHGNLGSIAALRSWPRAGHIDLECLGPLADHRDQRPPRGLAPGPGGLPVSVIGAASRFPQYVATQPNAALTPQTPGAAEPPDPSHLLAESTIDRIQQRDGDDGRPGHIDLEGLWVGHVDARHGARDLVGVADLRRLGCALAWTGGGYPITAPLTSENPTAWTTGGSVSLSTTSSSPTPVVALQMPISTRPLPDWQMTVP